MLIQFQDYLTFENIYIWLTFGVLPFWLMLIIIPNSRITQIFVNSIILPLILSAAVAYVIYQAILLEEPMLDIFKLYLGLDDLYAILSSENGAIPSIVNAILLGVVVTLISLNFI